MEDHDYLKNFICLDDFMASIDLSNPFFSIHVYEDSKKFLLFEFKDDKYNFYVTHFRLTSSHRIFTKIMKPVILHLSSKNSKVFA